MHHHVEKQAARNLDVFGRRWSRVSASDAYDFGSANGPTIDQLFCSTKTRIETTVEPNLKLHACILHRRQRLIDLLQGRIDRLFAKDCLSRPHTLFDEVYMGRGRGGDEDGVDLQRGKHVFGGSELPDIMLGRDFGRRGVVHIEDAGKFGARMGCDIVCMHAADAAAAKDCDTDQFVLP